VSPPTAAEPGFTADADQWKSFASGGDRDHDSRLPVPVPRNETGLTRRERRLKDGDTGSGLGRLIGMGAAALVVLGLLVFGGIKLFGGGGEDTKLADQSAVDDFVNECSLTAEGVGCVTEPTCYDAAFASAGCDGSHQWEAYATGQLPDGVTDVEGARADATVAAACVNGQRDDGPLSQLVGADAIDWATDVHLPGDGSFQCVAQLSNGTEASGAMFARAA
jgi:hypothetical protein